LSTLELGFLRACTLDSVLWLAESLRG